MKRLLSPYLAAIGATTAQSLWPVLGFGISMIVDYGALYYSFTMLAPHIGRDLGWGLSFTFGGISTAFFCAGLAAP